MPTAAMVLEITDSSARVLSGSSRGDACQLNGDGPPQPLVDAVLDWIDDPVGLLDERPVPVADLLRSLLETLVGPHRDAVVVVHPPDWPPHRVDRVVAAANAVADHVTAVRRDRWSDEAGEEPQEDQIDNGRAAGPRRLPMTAAGLRRLPMSAVLAGTAVVALAVAYLAIRSAPVPKDATGVTVTEGRMAVRIPAQWTVERVTGGPGSRRLQVSSPQDPGISVHLTWAYAPETTLAKAADVLTRAIGDEAPGVFVDLRPLDEVAGRPAVTYREVRPGRVIAWSVVLDGSTRISIGCQSPPGREAAVRAACDQAVRSARET